LVVVDYSTTWCGPCKVIAPKFDELSEKYPDAVFLKVRCCIPFLAIILTPRTISTMVQGRRRFC